MTTKEELDHKLDGTQPRSVAPEPDIAQPHPKQKAAMDLFEKIQSHRRMGISVDITGIAAKLRGAEARATFPESLFVTHFLPLFTGEVKQNDVININTWIEKVAGGDHVPVDLVDKDGKVIFTIPPMFDQSILDQSKNGGQTMTRIERQYSRLKEFDAAGSQVFLHKTLSGMHIKEKPTEEVYKNIATWNAIFTHYGKQDKIIHLLDPNNDPNKDRDSVGSGAKPSSADVGDYELDTD